MHRYSLLRHTGAPDDPIGCHFDLLLEDGASCRTWRLQEVDREKRRLISGGLFLAIGGTAMLLALMAGEVALLLWVQLQWNLTLVHSLLVLAATNLVLAGISLRVGGQLLKAPFLPQTLEGLSRTVRALLGRD